MSNNSPNPPFALHIGVGKTATTTFQETFFYSHPQINYLGKSHRQGTAHADFRAAIRDLIYKDTIDYDPTVLAGLLQQKSHKTEGLNLYSNECIIDADKDRGTLIDRIKHTFGTCKIILTIREQRAFMRALYGHDNNKLKNLPRPCNGRFIGIEDWLEYKTFELEHQRGLLFLVHYDKLIAYLHNVFGKQNVGVFLFEEFVSDRTSYLQKMCAFLEVDYLPELDEEIGRTHFNPEVASRWLQKHLYMDRLKREGSFLSKNDSLLRLAGALYSNLHKQPAPPVFEIPPQWQKKLADLFRESNQNTSQRYNLPLARFGYSV